MIRANGGALWTIFDRKYRKKDEKLKVYVKLKNKWEFPEVEWTFKKWTKN